MPRHKDGDFYNATADRLVDDVCSALMAAGFTVQKLTGSGILLIGAGNVNIILAVKRRAELTADQLSWLSRWRGVWTAVNGGVQALSVVRTAAKETIRLRPRDLDNDFLRKAGRAG